MNASTSPRATSTLCVVLSVGGDKYAIRCERVIEVAPCVALERLAMSPVWVAGAFVYRGQVTAVVDLNRLLVDSACPIRLSTRILLVSGGDERVVFGLLTERVSVVTRLDVHGAQGVRVAAAPAVSVTLRHEGELVRVIDVDALVPRGFVSHALPTTATSE